MVEFYRCQAPVGCSLGYLLQGETDKAFNLFSLPTFRRPNTKDTRLSPILFLALCQTLGGQAPY